MCAGAVICKQFILTAANCKTIIDKQQLQLDDLIVLGGRHDLYADEQGAQTNKIKSFIVHPKFMTIHDYDFALVELLQGFVLGGFSGSLEVFHMYSINLPLPGDNLKYREKGTRVMASR